MKLTPKQARRVREVKQEELAKFLGIHVQTYRKLEEKPELLTIGQAQKIAEFLKIPYDEIFFGS